MALRLENLTHRYGRQTALHDVSLHVRRGDCYGFLGHNGAGKTTALRIALGLLRPSAGHVFVDGLDAARHPALARAQTGGLIETPGFHANLSGHRNLVLLARVQGLARVAAHTEAARVLGCVGLAHAAEKPAGAYSQGMRQRLGIAQALLGRPPIVLLDEPTNGLDPEGIEEIRGLLTRLTRDEGTAVLLSSHQLHEIAGLCNRIAILREGRLLLEEETGALLAGGRHVLRAGDAGAAERVLDELGLVHKRRDDELLVAVETTPTERVLAALVAGGARPASFAPRPVTLEDVYLRFTRDPDAALAPRARAQDGAHNTDNTHNTDGTGSTDDAPGRTAHGVPPRGTLRVAAYELRRWSCARSVPALLALPALVAVAAIALRWLEASGFAAQVAGGDLASTTDVTAFEAVAVGLQASLPVLALVAAGLASQSLAGELSRGTLRNLLLRPLRRAHVALGKALAALVATTAAYVVSAGAALGAAALLFDFTDVTEVLFNGERFPLVAAAELRAPLREALAAPYPAVAAYAVLGFLAGAVTRRPAAALGTAFTLVAVQGVLRSVLRGFGLEWTVPAAHTPTALGDTSFVAHFLDLSRGVSNAAYEMSTASLAVPLVWIALALTLATWTLARRSIR